MMRGRGRRPNPANERTSQIRSAPEVSEPIGVMPRLPFAALRSPTPDNPLIGEADFSRIAGAPTRILSAGVIAASGQLPEYCAVIGYIEPAIEFELRLPTRTWNGRYFQTGCLSFCGVVAVEKCDDALSLNFAVAAENSGHVGNGGLWGRNNKQLRIDYGYRSAHVMAVAAKAIIEAFYGLQPTRSYFRGCSMGGRQAVVEAQRYPRDFDGFLAGAPAFPTLQNAISNPWLAQKGRRGNGSIILEAGPTLTRLHQAVLDVCDGIDGLIDGLIDDPRNCTFDVSTADFLTPEQAQVARDFYAGPHKQDGRRLYPGWVFHGSELDWENAVNASTFYSDEMLRFLAFRNSPSLSYSYRDFDHESDVPAVRWALGTYDGINPDLSAFQARGGKFMLYHGLADTTTSAMVSINLRHKVAEAHGGPQQLGTWFRLFTIPGMFHCGGGPLPVQIGTDGDSPAGAEPLLQLVAWVENDLAPDRLIASYLSDGEVTRTRPVYPYPAVARYSGSGSIDDAASFSPAEPPVIHDDDIKWIFADYRPPSGS